jgi:hypothetical protein
VLTARLIVFAVHAVLVVPFAIRLWHLRGILRAADSPGVQTAPNMKIAKRTQVRNTDITYNQCLAQF